MREQWIKFKDREFSNLGRVRNPVTGNILKGTTMVHGYKAIDIEGVKKSFARSVWMAFNGEIPDGYQVNHINHIKTDNRLINLELVTRKQNVQKALEAGVIPISDNAPSAKLNAKQVRIIQHAYAWGTTQTALGKIFSCSSSHVSRIVNGLKRRYDQI